MISIQGFLIGTYKNDGYGSQWYGGSLRAADGQHRVACRGSLPLKASEKGDEQHQTSLTHEKLTARIRSGQNHMILTPCRIFLSSTPGQLIQPGTWGHGVVGRKEVRKKSPSSLF